MSLALVLFIRSLQNSWKRLVLAACSVGVGVLILLLFTAGFNGLTGRTAHTSWRETVFQAVGTSQQPAAGVQPLYAMLSSTSNVDSYWRDTQIYVTQLAASDEGSPHLHELRTPAPGEYYVSPGLKKVMDEHPEDNIGQRFGNKLLGVIPDKYVTSPDELSVVRGIELSQAKHLSEIGASIAKLYHIDEKPVAFSGYSKLLMAVLYLGIFILLFPVMLLVSIAAQLGGSQREQRYAALRLIGATKAQVRRIMMVESLIASAIGVITGFLLYVIARPLVLGFKFEDMRFWPQDEIVPMSEIIGIIIVTLIFTAIANWWAMHHVQTSPLGVVRRSSRRRQPRWWRLIPLVIGLGIIGLAISPLTGGSKNTIALLIIGSVVVLMFGLVIAGPYITRQLSGFIARHTRRAETLLGMKYISLNSGSVFRSVAGVVVALFAGSFFLACTSGMQHLSEQSIKDNGYARLQTDTVLISSDMAGSSLPNDQSSMLQKLTYIRAATQIKKVGYSVEIMPCQTAATYTSIECPAGMEYVGVNFDKQDFSEELYGATENDIYKQMSDISPYFNTSSVTPNYLVKIDHSNIDKLRSYIVTHYIQEGSINVAVFSGADAQRPYINPIIKEFGELAYIGIGITVIVAIISLAISTIGSLLERRRSLVTLRLGGMSVGSLKRVIIIESLIPLLSVTIISAGLGLIVGFVMMSQLTATVHSVLSMSYLVLFVSCIVVTVATIMCILPSVRRIADPESIQTE